MAGAVPVIVHLLNLTTLCRCSPSPPMSRVSTSPSLEEFQLRSVLTQVLECEQSSLTCSRMTARLVT